MSDVSTRRVIGGYELHTQLAVGGMASVHLGRSLQQQKLVAIKRLHEHLAQDPSFAAVLLQEAHISGRIDHPNVVRTLDVVTEDGEIVLVMEYVVGETVARLARSMAMADQPCAVDIAASVIRDALRGLDAAHQTRDANGVPLEVVHRDVSPQNVIVGTDGVARVLDFGIAKVIGSMIHTRTGELKGKIPYMAPEVLELEPATPQSDVWGAAVILWELLCGRRLFKGESDVAVWAQVLNEAIPTPAEMLGAATVLDAIVMRGLSRDRSMRYQSAAEMADDIERAIAPAPPSKVAAWVESLASTQLAARSEMVNGFQRTLVMRSPPPSERGRAVVSQEARAPAARLQRTAPAAWVLVGLLLFVVTALLFKRSYSSASAEERSTALDAGGVPSGSVASSAAPPASASAGDESHDAPLARASAAPVTAPPKPRERAHVSPRTRAPSAAGCDPPYSVDSAGRKIFKLECIR